MTPPFYRRPSPVRRRVIDPLIAMLLRRARRGAGGEPDGLRVLRVRGRTTGLPRDVAIGVAAIDGERYILSMLGESQWVRNLRASGTAELVVGRDVEHVSAREIRGAEKSAFLASYLSHPAYALRARVALRIDSRRLTSAAVDSAGMSYPVFRLEHVT
jgi:deazaflavin-dependent oxidoreductase (nitroreductase family)